jgi:hypothetical protein
MDRVRVCSLFVGLGEGRRGSCACALGGAISVCARQHGGAGGPRPRPGRDRDRDLSLEKRGERERGRWPPDRTCSLSRPLPGRSAPRPASPRRVRPGQAPLNHSRRPWPARPRADGRGRREGSSKKKTKSGALSRLKLGAARAPAAVHPTHTPITHPTSLHAPPPHHLSLHTLTSSSMKKSKKSGRARTASCTRRTTG